MRTRLILSIFPGIDLLGRGFEDRGYCVVRGPDLITGGDVRTFKPPAAIFDGVIGGPPCQDFSTLNRTPGPYSDLMLAEYCRVITEARPAWFLFENVATAPSFKITGYHQQRFALDLAWFTPFSRNRYFTFGSRGGQLLNPINGVKKKRSLGTAITGQDARSFRACCDIQGLPPGFDLPFFTLTGKKQAVGNAVPLVMARYLAALITETLHARDRIKKISPDKQYRRCACGCGRVVVGRELTASTSCRKRKQRAAASGVTPRSQ